MILLCSVYISSGQVPQRERFFQVSGIITDETSRPLANVGVISVKLRRGAVSERTGIYAITSTPGDTILFRAVGYKRLIKTIPESFEGKLYTMDIVMSPDTIAIKEVVILPWSSYNDFIKDMAEPRAVSPEIAFMNENLATIEAEVANTTGVKITAEAGYRYAMQQNFDAMATRNQYPVNNLLNPFAWAKFFSGVKDGMLKNQASNSPKPAKVKKAKTKNKSSDNK